MIESPCSFPVRQGIGPLLFACGCAELGVQKELKRKAGDVCPLYLARDELIHHLKQGSPRWLRLHLH